MAQFMGSDARTARTRGDDFLFKPDRPRRIDRYIDYYGTPELRSAPGWLERLLESLRPPGGRTG
jgi:hypothetical protein